MRLLQTDDNGNLSLAEFSEPDIPKYAILSHTWGKDEEEVSFDDIRNGSYEDRKGYEKIRFCRERARQDDLQYFWIDTCCIDKSNSAELSRSLSSMFRWYRNAAHCYVYLTDVSSLDSDDGYGSKQPRESKLRQSRWFTRGWTLEELLAPASVEFFSREGQRLGDKSSLQTQICEITNIPCAALQAQSLFPFSIEERLRWIQHRQTTLEEDRIYSLLGIFGIYLLPIYGEGFAKAHDRLLAEYHKVQQYIHDLHLSDPVDDKARIEKAKGGLVGDSCHWVLESSKFRAWQSNQQHRLLWIKGDPGKGKTMLLCAIINHLERSKNQLRHGRPSWFDIYACLSATISISHMRAKYDQAGKKLFEDANAWVALSEILAHMLQDLNIHGTYLIINGLDECITDLPKLLDFIVHVSSSCPRVKWIVSSRNWSSIGKILNPAMQKLTLCLELNEQSVSAAIASFIQFRVSVLAKANGYNSKTRDIVQQHLISNANGTFLWVALVCQGLSTISSWKVKQKLAAFPAGLDALYQRMLAQILDSEDAELCKHILATFLALYRPITLDELVTLVEMPDEVTSDYGALSEIIDLCGSFLTLRGHTVSFVHQSAKEFLTGNVGKYNFLYRLEDMHYQIFSRSIMAMSCTLRRDIYGLRAPGCTIKEVELPALDLLATVEYSCVFWIDHLLACQTRETSNQSKNDDSSVHEFLAQSLLCWFEALSLKNSMSVSVLGIRKLVDWAQVYQNPELRAFLNDAIRFVLYNRSIIEHAPLQTYCSALIFAPEKSIIRNTFAKNIPSWIKTKPGVDAHWNAMLQILEGHTGWVSSVAFSPDGTQIVSSSEDKTVRLWDATTGTLQQTLEGHTDWVRAVAFSPDGKQIASGSGDGTVWLWDAMTGTLQQTLEGHTGSVSSIAFSPDGKQIVSGSEDQTVRLWDATTGTLQQTLEGHAGSVRAIAFSPERRRIVSGSHDKTVRLWDATTGTLLQTLKGHTDWISSVAFSPDSKQIVSGSYDKTVRLWDATTGTLQQTLKGHTGWVSSIAFSPDGKQIVSGSNDRTVRLWDATIGTLEQTFEGHADCGQSFALSPNGSLLPTLYVKEAWLVNGRTNMLWLPSDYRPSCQAIHGTIVAMGHSSGQVSIIMLGKELISVKQSGVGAAFESTDQQEVVLDNNRPKKIRLHNDEAGADRGYVADWCDMPRQLGEQPDRVEPSL